MTRLLTRIALGGCLAALVVPGPVLAQTITPDLPKAIEDGINQTVIEGAAPDFARLCSFAAV